MTAMGQSQNGIESEVNAVFKRNTSYSYYSHQKKKKKPIFRINVNALCKFFFCFFISILLCIFFLFAIFFIRGCACSQFVVKFSAIKLPPKCTLKTIQNEFYLSLISRGKAYGAHRMYPWNIINSMRVCVRALMRVYVYEQKRARDRNYQRTRRKYLFIYFFSLGLVCWSVRGNVHTRGDITLGVFFFLAQCLQAPPNDSDPFAFNCFGTRCALGIWGRGGRGRRAMAVKACAGKKRETQNG